MPAGDDPAYAASQAVKAGAALVVLYGGDSLPSGGIGLDDGVTVPVVGIPADVGARVVQELADGRSAHVSVGRVSSEASATAGGVAPFSSRGLAFDGFVKPDLVAPGVGLLTSDPGKAEDGSARYSSISGTSASAAIVAGAAALLAQARPQLDASALKGLLAGSARALPGESVTGQGTGLLDLGAASAGETAALPTTLSFGRAKHREGWHATRRLVLRNLSSRRLRIELASDSRDRGGARALVFAFAPSQVRIRPHGIATVYVAVRALAPVGNPVEGRFAVRPEGGDAIHVPWLIMSRPRHDELLSSIRLSSRSFKPSDSAPAVLSFQGGRLDTGGQLEPVALLQLQLRRQPRPAARDARPAPRSPPRPLRLRAHRPRRQGQHAGARPLHRAADRVPDRPGRTQRGDGPVHHSVTHPDGLILASRNIVICSRFKE